VDQPEGTNMQLDYKQLKQPMAVNKNKVAVWSSRFEFTPRVWDSQQTAYLYLSYTQIGMAAALYKET
jgi:hypothetical protein